MQKMAITRDEAELLLQVLRADDTNNRYNDLDREPCFEALEAKLICVLRIEGAGGWMLTDEEIAALSPETRA